MTKMGCLVLTPQNYPSHPTVSNDLCCQDCHKLWWYYLIRLQAQMIPVDTMYRCITILYNHVIPYHTMWGLSISYNVYNHISCVYIQYIYIYIYIHITMYHIPQILYSIPQILYSVYIQYDVLCIYIYTTSILPCVYIIIHNFKYPSLAKQTSPGHTHHRLHFHLTKLVAQGLLAVQQLLHRGSKANGSHAA